MGAKTGGRRLLPVNRDGHCRHRYDLLPNSEVLDLDTVR